MAINKWIKVRKAMIHHYHTTPLYYQNPEGKYILYKDKDTTISLKRVREEEIPQLYIQMDKKEESILELQERFNKDIQEDLQKGDINKAKGNLVNIMAETLNEPRSGTLKNMNKTVDIFIEAHEKDSDILKTLFAISQKDYTTALHSVNVMALTMGFCFHMKFPKHKIREYGLSAMFHDLGKTKVPLEILNAQRKLTKFEFSIMQSHPVKGYEILRQLGFSNENFLMAALQHHEKLDGSGYPYGITQISEIGQILAIIDIYEAVTNDDRPYRNAMEPINALSILKSERDRGKIAHNIFENFAYSLI